MLHFIMPLVLIGGFVYLLLCLYLYFMQEKLLFYPDTGGRDLVDKPSDIGLQFDTVQISTSDNIWLYGWYIPAERSRATLLFFHGNAGNISHRLDSIRIFHDLGLSVLIFDYRGYGRSGGKISEPGTYLDGEAVWNYLVDAKKVDPQQVILFGRSLGGAVAADIAAKHHPGALILESTFTSVPDMAARLYPVFPVRLLARFIYNTRLALQSVTCPVLIIHSPDDEIIPFENGRILYETAGEPKHFLEIRGGHNDGFLVSGSTYTDGLKDFLDRFKSR